MTDQTADDDYLWARRHEVLYQVRLSALYHRKRERFLSFWDRAITAIAIIGGSAAFGGVGGPDLARYAAAGIAITSTFGLVFALAERARLHSEMARQFINLEARIRRQGERTFTEEQVADWRAEVTELEASEPPALGALVLACQNELAQAAGEAGHIRRLSWWRRLTMHFTDYRVPA